MLKNGKLDLITEIVLLKDQTKFLISASLDGENLDLNFLDFFSEKNIKTNMFNHNNLFGDGFYNMMLVVNSDNAKNLEREITNYDRLRLNYSMITDLAIIQMIGVGAKTNLAILQQVFNILPQKNIVLEGIAISETRIDLLISSSKATILLKMLNEQV